MEEIIDMSKSPFTRQATVQRLIERGITDPVEMKKLLDQEAKSQGLAEFSLEEIQGLVTREKNPLNIAPDDERFMKTARAAGLTEEQITLGLVKKKQALQESGQVVNSDGTPAVATTDPTKEVTPVNDSPFGGRSKQEVLKLAFQSGITKTAALKDIADTYDLVTGTKDEILEGSKAWSYADELIKLNPDASKEELSVELRKKTKLDVSDINTVLDEAGFLSKKDTPSLTEDSLKSVARALVKKNIGVFGDSKDGLEKAKAQIEGGKIKVNDKEVTLSASQINKIKTLMDEEYPNGRTILQRLLPGGK